MPFQDPKYANWNHLYFTAPSTTVVRGPFPPTPRLLRFLRLRKRALEFLCPVSPARDFVNRALTPAEFKTASLMGYGARLQNGAVLWARPRRCYQSTISNGRRRRRRKSFTPLDPFHPPPLLFRPPFVQLLDPFRPPHVSSEGLCLHHSLAPYESLSRRKISCYVQKVPKCVRHKYPTLKEGNIL